MAKLPVNKTIEVKLFIYLAIWLLTFYKGIETAVDVWITSEIYNHCLLILPIVAYFIYLKRADIIQKYQQESMLWVAPYILLLAIYTFASFGDIKILMHGAAFSSLIVIIYGAIGWPATKKIIYPLGLILFCIPIGDQLVPFLQELTTDIAVPLLEWTNVPIYRSGLYLEIPEGRFLVAEACSGISFLISTFAFGYIYSYVSFSSIKKRAIFISLSIIVPLLANALRVYGIILTGHLTNMEHAVGADHLIYGGVFFGVILFILIFLGEIFRDKDRKLTSSSALTTNNNVSIKLVSIASVLFVCFSVTTAIWISKGTSTTQYDLSPVKLTNINIQEVSKLKWLPPINNASLAQYFNVGTVEQHTQLFIAQFNEAESELISSQHRYFNDDSWTPTKAATLSHAFGEAKQLALVNSDDRKLFLYVVFEVNGRFYASETKTKLYQTYLKMIGRNPNGKLIILANENSEIELPRLNVIFGSITEVKNTNQGNS
ncbi:exosortase A [Thalassotalea eurytherma]|uniref:Exosortase A n=1 Tax=Thalassotalea eurytherma TaxID=1144278 RepID=A0ABQ6H5Q6_9GAMM|nr:exosortase A [Thalassotalea eurytherma]GLX82090.1 hypothetical protein theurythT_15420 [Thalassotalea eurytherma]